MRSAVASGLGLALLAAVLPQDAAGAPPKACRISVEASVDYETFRKAGHALAPARLARLRGLTRDRFEAAARRLCSAGVLRPADLARFGRLAVQNGEGATEPVIFREESSGEDIFVFQYAFQQGGPPEPAAFEQALRCWKRPRSRGCDLGD